MKKAVARDKEPSTLRIFCRNFLHNVPGMTGLFIITVMILAAIFAIPLSGHNPDYIDPINSRLAPGWGHLMGTDQLGRDMLSRVLYGARQSIYIGVLASLLANLIGTVLGAVAGYLGGKFDTIVLRISELVMTFPQLILVLIEEGIILNIDKYYLSQAIDNLIINSINYAKSGTIAINLKRNNEKEGIIFSISLS